MLQRRQSLTRTELASQVQYSATTSLMTSAINPWPSVPSGGGASGQGSGQTCDAAEGAKNIWARTRRHWKLNLALFNTRDLWSEASLSGLFEELSDISWDIIGLSEVRKTGEVYTELTNSHAVCHGRLPDKREHGIGLLIHKDIACHIDEFYSIIERVGVVVIKLNSNYRMKVVQAYARTSSHDDEEIEQLCEDVN